MPQPSTTIRYADVLNCLTAIMNKEPTQLAAAEGNRAWSPASFWFKSHLAVPLLRGCSERYRGRRAP